MGMRILAAAVGLSLLAGNAGAITRDDTTQVPYPILGQAGQVCALPSELSGLHAVLAQQEGKKKPLACEEIAGILGLSDKDPKKTALLATRRFIEAIKRAGKASAKTWKIDTIPAKWEVRYLTKEEFSDWREVTAVIFAQQMGRG